MLRQMVRTIGCLGCYMRMPYTQIDKCFLRFYFCTRALPRFYLFYFLHSKEITCIRNTTPIFHYMIKTENSAAIFVALRCSDCVHNVKYILSSISSVCAFTGEECYVIIFNDVLSLMHKLHYISPTK
ncbi:hypothetical protein KP509_30G036900 [Ceratopteris richardii]|uniref:Uncharacterized protein n=1 Tax=Ceratopteris richardii TaxID=49495 RepID=A0A8T2R3C5_CERRI|nr:hypothetical protein KP509_30G036900 [Ceratopteris richardii]